MVGVREIPRTAAFAWSSSTSKSLVATGTRAGAVDADFSNETQLEIWDLVLDNHGSQELQPVASVNTDSRFHDIAWAPETGNFPQGIIAGALDNGSFDLWNAQSLLDHEDSSHISRTMKHNGPIKALQFNPSKPLLATAGAKGELYISDLNNVQNPFRMGNSVARADDFDCLDWNKKVPHILATGSSGGFVTVWDASKKKESLTLNNMGRKAVSAIAWDPEKHTRLITACRDDNSPVILVWDLRNSNAPEKILKGHDAGVLSLSWCLQDNDLLLSCGMDNRNICWNPQTGDSLGEFPIVTNWTFETRWNPSNPNLIATASFDGKIAIHTLQNSTVDLTSKGELQGSDDADFFNQSQQKPQSAGFSLEKAPKWLQRPCGANFGFGGKVISFKAQAADNGTQSTLINLTPFAPDDEVASSIGRFEEAMDAHSLSEICKARIAEAQSEAERADWKVMETLTAPDFRSALPEYLGFPNVDNHKSGASAKPSIDGSLPAQDGTLQTETGADAKNNRLSAFFDGKDDDTFLSDLAATKGAKTNSPFQIYSGSESDPDKQITRALILGQFETALDVTLEQDRLSDAFMIAICGGPQCIEKVQKAYFGKQKSGPNYLRLLASIVGKNLWDTVYNADLSNWKEVMAALCSYATPEDFPDLCEGLGDRIEEGLKENLSDSSVRKDASFCYLVGSKLEKVVHIWLQELHEEEEARSSDEVSPFTIHVRCLQTFIEKVSVYREVTRFNDADRNATSDWKLAALYDRYVEYADILATNGQLQAANKYLNLLPEAYPAATLAKNRVHSATQKASAQTPSRLAANANLPQRGQPAIATSVPQRTQARSQTPVNPYAPAGSSQGANPYAPSGAISSNGTAYPSQNGYPQTQSVQPPPRQQPSMVPPPTTFGSMHPHMNGQPPRNFTSSPSVPPPSQAKDMTNWNDTPESFFKPPPPRRSTPSVATPGIAPGPGPQSALPSGLPAYGAQPKSTPPLGPPPKGPVGPPPRNFSPSAGAFQSHQQPTERPSSSAANVYAPPQSQPAAPSAIPPPQRPSIPRGPSPYNAPPSGPPPSNRYAPNPSAQRSQPEQPPPPSTRQGPPPPNPYASPSTTSFPQRPPSQPAAAPPLGGPPRGPPPQGRPPDTEQSGVQGQQSNPPVRKHPPGDRSHIPMNAKPIFEVLSSEFQRVKAKAPAAFKAHVIDAEKRLNILYDHLNNEDLLTPDTVESMVELAQAIRVKAYEEAQAIHIDIVTNKSDQTGQWMVGVKRLIAMSKSTP